MTFLKYRGSVYLRDAHTEPTLGEMTILSYRGTVYCPTHAQLQNAPKSCPPILKYRGSCYFMESKSA